MNLYNNNLDVTGEKVSFTDEIEDCEERTSTVTTSLPSENEVIQQEDNEDEYSEAGSDSDSDTDNPDLTVDVCPANLQFLCQTSRSGRVVNINHR